MRWFERGEGLLHLKRPDVVGQAQEEPVGADLDPDGRPVAGREEDRERPGQRLVCFMPAADVADHPLVRVLEGDEAVRGDRVVAPVHPGKRPLRKGDRTGNTRVAVERPGPPERPDLPGNGERHRDLLPLPRRDLTFRPGGRLDRDPAPLHLENPPELALGDEDRAGVHPAEDERLVQGPDRAARDDIEDLHLPLVVDHGEVFDEVAPCASRPDDPGAVEPDQAVLRHLAADGVEERPRAGKDARSLDHLPDAGDLDLAVFDRDRRDLVREHVCGAGGRDDPLALVRLCPACDHERL